MIYEHNECFVVVDVRYMNIMNKTNDIQRKGDLTLKVIIPLKTCKTSDYLYRDHESCHRPSNIYEP